MIAYAMKNVEIDDAKATNEAIKDTFNDLLGKGVSIQK